MCGGSLIISLALFAEWPVRRQFSAQVHRMCPADVRLTLYVCHIHVEVRLLQGGMHVEQVGHEGQVELAVPVGDVVGGDELPAVQPRRLLQHQLGPLGQIVLLQAHREEEGG